MEETSRRTVGHYEERAEAFWEGTRDHDVSQNIDALLSCLPEGGVGKRVLDFGCGPGRDLEALTKRGVAATGLDGCESFCAMARTARTCVKWCAADMRDNINGRHTIGTTAK